MKHRQPYFHVCSFSSLDSLPKRHHGSEAHVLAALNNAGRFSCFEVEGQLATTLARIIREKKAVTTDLGYPWTGVELTDLGRDALSEDG